MTTKPPLQKVLQEILHTENESKQTMRKQAAPNYRRRKDKDSESNINSAVHNQTFKQQQLNDRNHHIPININTNIDNDIGLNSPIKRHHLANCIKKEDPIRCCLQETHLIDKNKHWFRMKSWKKIYQAHGP
jgi:uncharacterized membrane protein YheB (UPF0754 family)